MATSTDPEDGQQGGGAFNRIRWATRRLSVKTSKKKRLSLMRRTHAKSPSNEKSKTGDGVLQQPSDTDSQSTEDPAENRTLFFNIKLPAELLDEDGHPVQKFPRNKIRTAKYTPLSFLPKNLWFQFHNVANIFFLFLVVLVFFPIFGGGNPGLNVVPLAFIVTVTAIKDAVEDSRRTRLDNELNNAPVHRLCNWKNENVVVDNVSAWRKFKKANSRFFSALWRLIRSIWSQQARKKRREVAKAKRQQQTEDEPRPSIESRASHRRSLTVAPSRQSFANAAEDIQMTPVPSPLPQQTPLTLPLHSLEPPAALSLQHSIKPDLVNHFREVKGARFRKDTWKSLTVGDFVRIYNDDELPADILVVSTSDDDGACYVETKNLDGETNLKVRQALRCGRSMRHARDCERAEFMIDSEAPQPNLYKYNGVIRWRQAVPEDQNADPVEMSEPITIDNLLLRGCNLRNTEWVLGIVIFTGHDTKIMMNAGVTPSKRSRIAREMNINVFCNFGILLVMCILSAIVNGWFWSQSDESMAFFDYGSVGGTPALTGFINFWASIILFQNLVPISLYITLEVVRTLQAIFIYSDVEMYYEVTDQPCIPKAWNISDDVGQIEYIFSDKTGTLTQNVMEFKKCTINGQPYGEAYTEAQAGLQKRLGIDVEKESEKANREIAEAKVKAIERLRSMHDNPYLHDQDLTFIAPDFVADLSGESGPEQKSANERFMLALALCHSVIVEKVAGEPPGIIFKAQSPDEAALVATARDMGFTVLGTSGDVLFLNVLGEERQYTILNILEFNSTRKRMSAIVRMTDGQIVLFCKGADTVIYSRLKKGEQRDLRRRTAEHLEMFAREGLRTLCVAQRVLEQEEYLHWKKQYDVAAAALEDREDKIEAVATQIEQELTLLGGTAIEDRLQDGVPETISLLADAGIKLWVLTGDKVETAINIGFSCNLLNNDMELVHVRVDEDEDGETTDEQYVARLDHELQKHLKSFGLAGSDQDLAAARKNHEPPEPTHALIIDGFSLKWVLNDGLKQKFLLLCKQCKSVLCCRVSPAQKASVVGLVKNGLDVMTLAVGDGANDVAMIQEADVGIGISGVEGQQAAMSSDYSIAQFRFLQRLLLVHGRWSYRRLAETIPNFFYKNMVWTFSIFWYQAFCGFDTTYIFDYSYILLFNVIFTSFPVGVMGVLDQDVSDCVSVKAPQLYRRGILQLEWTQRKFWLYMLDGIYQSVMIFFIPYLTFSFTTVTHTGININDVTRLGCYIAHPAVITINLYILMNSYRWDWLSLLIIAISDISIIFWTAVYTSFTVSEYFYNAAAEVYSQPSFWAVFILTPVICLFPRFAVKATQKLFFPYDVDIIREQQHYGGIDNVSAIDESAVVATVAAPKGKQSGPSLSVDDDSKPIYPPSDATRANHHSQNGSESTTDGGAVHGFSLDLPRTYPGRPSIERSRPSFDRILATMDPVRRSFEASSDFTTAARLCRIESSHSHIRVRSRGLSLTKSADR